MPFDHGLPGTPSTHNADDYPTVAAVKYMSQLLAQKSGGKNKIKDFNKQALGSEKVTVDQVKIGTLDLTRVNVGPMNAICPLTQVLTLPFRFSSMAHLRQSLDGPNGEEIRVAGQAAPGRQALPDDHLQYAQLAGC